jgi:hypothetical protein
LNLLVAIALIALGVLLTISALLPLSWDFAVAVAPGWHVTVWPAPLWLGLLLVLVGGLALLASAPWR